MSRETSVLTLLENATSFDRFGLVQDVIDRIPFDILDGDAGPFTYYDAIHKVLVKAHRILPFAGTIIWAHPLQAISNIVHYPCWTTIEPVINPDAFYNDTQTREAKLRAFIYGQNPIPGTLGPFSRAELTELELLSWRECLSGIHPPETLRILGRYNSSMWQILKAAECFPGFPQYIERNPGIAFAAATLTEGKALHNIDLQRMKKKECLAVLGYPSQDGVARLLNKIPTTSITPVRTRWLRKALNGDDRLIKHLSYAHSLTAELLACFNPLFWPHVITKRFITQLAEEDNYYWGLNHYLFRKGSAATMLSLALRFKLITSPVNDILQFNRLCSLVEKRLAESIIFPKGPFPEVNDSAATILYCKSARDLLLESALMRNCSNSYLSAVCAGHMCFYSMREPARCTIALKRNGKHFTLFQMKPPGNRGLISREAWRIVKTWIRSNRSNQEV